MVLDGASWTSHPGGRHSAAGQWLPYKCTSPVLLRTTCAAGGFCDSKRGLFQRARHLHNHTRPRTLDPCVEVFTHIHGGSLCSPSEHCLLSFCPWTRSCPVCTAKLRTVLADVNTGELIGDQPPQNRDGVRAAAEPSLRGAVQRTNPHFHRTKIRTCSCDIDLCG